MKHTPGPWAISHLKDLGHKEIVAMHIDGGEGEPLILAYVYDGGNAPLIAAAPEMLSELREARIQLAGSGLYHDHPTLKRIDAIIAKAEGA